MFTGPATGMVVGLAAPGDCLGWKGFCELENYSSVIVYHYHSPSHWDQTTFQDYQIGSKS